MNQDKQADHLSLVLFLQWAVVVEVPIVVTELKPGDPVLLQVAIPGTTVFYLLEHFLVIEVVLVELMGVVVVVVLVV
jgi:hypothetical protein